GRQRARLTGAPDAHPQPALSRGADWAGGGLSRAPNWGTPGLRTVGASRVHAGGGHPEPSGDLTPGDATDHGRVADDDQHIGGPGHPDVEPLLGPVTLTGLV